MDDLSFVCRMVGSGTLAVEVWIQLTAVGRPIAGVSPLHEVTDVASMLQKLSRMLYTIT